MMKPIFRLVLFVVAVAFLALPSGASNAVWKETVLASFTGIKAGTNGARPEAGLIFDTAGNLYGTTVLGGKFGHGTVFKLSPPNGGGGRTAWTQTILHSFSGADGADPWGGLIFDPMGHLYGTTAGGGTGNGTVFKLSPPAAGKTAWTETVLYSFPTNSNGLPETGLIFDGSGNLYGTTSTTIHYDSRLPPTDNCPCGAVFKLTPPVGGQTDWTETTLYSFGFTDGAAPQAGLILDASGNLYGTTATGGAGWNGIFWGGTVFKLTPPLAGQTVWSESVLFSFSDESTGVFPESGLIFDSVGNLYGTTAGGNTGSTAFKLSPPAPGQTAWSETVLASFLVRGNKSEAALTFDAAGNLYGTTAGGHGQGYGTVFKLSPPAAGKASWTQTVLFDFKGPNGAGPQAGLILDSAGNLYGTTNAGGNPSCPASYNGHGCGLVFKLTP